MPITEPAARPGSAGLEAVAGGMRSKAAAVYLAGLFGVLSLLGAAYIFVIELATPRTLWLEEYRLFIPSGADDYAVGPAGLRIAALLPEPGVFGRYADCETARRRAMAAGDWTAASRHAAECLDAIEAALRGMPASAALWFHRARLLAASGTDDAAVDQSLRMSYRAGAREGWIMPARLSFALRRWEQMPEDLRRIAKLDAAIMLQNASLRRELARTYWRNPSIRDLLTGLVEETATAEEKNEFVRYVRDLMKGNTIP